MIRKKLNKDGGGWSKKNRRCWWVEKESKVVKVGQGARRAYPQLIHPPTYPTLPRWAASVEKVGGKKWCKKAMVRKRSGAKKKRSKNKRSQKELV